MATLALQHSLQVGYRVDGCEAGLAEIDLKSIFERT